MSKCRFDLSEDCNSKNCLTCERNINKAEPCEEIHREREQSYMQGYEDASKRFRVQLNEDILYNEYMRGFDKGYIKAKKETEPCEDAVSKAIETIVNYCSERTCRNCRLFSSEGCIFKCSYPHEWIEIQKELEGESE